MADMDFLAVFQEEAAELLEELETSLLELENSPEDLKIVGRVFRSMHTIKGSAAMFGFDAISDFTHHVETVLDKVRDGSISVTGDLINLTLKSRDHIKLLLEAAAGGDEPDPVHGPAIIEALNTLTEGNVPAGKARTDAGHPAPPAAADSPPAPDQEPGDSGAGHLRPEETTYHIVFKPGPDFFAEGGDMGQLLAELENLGSRTIGHEGPLDAASLDREPWRIQLTTGRDINAVKDVFIFAESSSELSITPHGEPPPPSSQPERHVSPPATPVLKPSGQERVRKCESAKIKGQDNIRVAADKLDKLINLVGELVVTQARLTDVANVSAQIDLLEPVEQIEHLTAELRDLVLNIRMLPIGTTFARFRRLVRDLSRDLGKEVSLETEGEETELDKTVIEQLNDPLIHLIRNSIDHGIEQPEERRQAGKDSAGTLRLSASHTGANVVITISDDGQGLHPERIRAKAEERGLIRPDDFIEEQELINLIFRPGFSTVTKVSSVSGRGVGMDVVKNAIEKLRGSIHLASTPGQGTEVTITLPLTLAIIEGLLVRTGDTYFVLPLAEVEECVELTAADIARHHDRRVFSVRDRLLPYIRLRDFFQFPGSRPDREQMVIIHLHGDRVGLVVEEVIGGHQTVIKSLGWVYRNAPGISGSTILGNGQVALIIDTQELMSTAKNQEKAVLN